MSAGLGRVGWRGRDSATEVEGKRRETMRRWGSETKQSEIAVMHQGRGAERAKRETKRWRKIVCNERENTGWRKRKVWARCWTRPLFSQFSCRFQCYRRSPWSPEVRLEVITLYKSLMIPWGKQAC